MGVAGPQKPSASRQCGGRRGQGAGLWWLGVRPSLLQPGQPGPPGRACLRQPSAQSRTAQRLQGIRPGEQPARKREGCVRSGPPPNVPVLSVCMSKVLFFDDEAGRAAFVQHLRQGWADVSVKEMTEEELLKEALTREQRAQIVETFIRHAFAKVGVSRICSPPPADKRGAEVDSALTSIPAGGQMTPPRCWR